MRSMLRRFKTLSEFNKNTKLSAASLEELQKKKLQTIVEHAYETTVFYKKWMDDAGVKPKHITKKAHLERIPPIEKKHIQQHFDSFISNAVDLDKCLARTTSGSSGKMLRVLWDNYNFDVRLAVFYRCFQMVGYSPFKKILCFLPAPEEIGFTFGLYRSKTLELGLKKDKIREELFRFKPHILSIYPSYAMHIATLFSSDELKKLNLQAISLNSEMILPADRRAVSEAYGCPVYDEYSSVEMGPIASMCKHGNMHIFPDNVCLEILDQNGESCKAGERGEIVLTALNSFAMPFIRYRQGDYASFANGECMCGMETQLITSVEGRKDDSFYLGDNKKIPAWQIYEVVERPLKKYGMNKLILKDFYLVQKNNNEAQFYFVKGQDFQEQYINELIVEAAKLFGNDFDFILNETSSIDRVRTVKRKYIHCEVG